MQCLRGMGIYHYRHPSGSTRRLSLQGISWIHNQRNITIKATSKDYTGDHSKTSSTEDTKKQTRGSTKAVEKTYQSSTNTSTSTDIKTMTEIHDDKAAHVIPFILETYNSFRTFSQSTHDQINPRPFFVGLNGVQGAGKSVLVSILLKILTKEPYNLPTTVFSLDDIYLTHSAQTALASTHRDNPLLQHRGQPSTHDIALGLQVFQSLRAGQPTRIPRYDKSAFHGQGDRVSSSQWETVNETAAHKIKIVLFEGWCVGFRPLPEEILRAKHASALEAAAAATAGDSTNTNTNTSGTNNGGNYQGRLGHNNLRSVMDINEALKSYDALTNQLDAFIHIDAADPLYVYDWRLQQERELRKSKGSGMTDEQVREFVDGYYPAYELYTEPLRQGVFDTATAANDAAPYKGKQLRIIVNKDRKVETVIRI